MDITYAEAALSVEMSRRVPQGVNWRSEASRMPQEYHQHAPDIKLLKQVVLTRPGYTEKVDFTQHYTTQLQEIAVTMGIETGTTRTTQMEQWLKDMIKGDADLEARGFAENIRVVIAKRGVMPYGVVFPDGTIIISQSIINALVTEESPATEDELASVFAHELGHLKRKTFERLVFGEQFKQQGAMFIHEGAADGDTQRFLENADFNSTAFKSAIKKISEPHKTDTVHGSGNARVAQSELQHTFVHSETSAQNQKPLDPEWVAEEIIPTNKEIAAAMIHDINLEVEAARMQRRDIENPVQVDEAKHVLQGLNETDLAEIADTFQSSETMQQALANVLGERLQEYSPAERKAFLITLLSPKEAVDTIPEAIIIKRIEGSLLKIALIQNGEELEEIVSAIIHNDDIFGEMHNNLFDDKLDDRFLLIKTLSFIRTNMSLVPTESYEFPIEWEQLEKVLLDAKSVDLSQIDQKGNQYRDDAISYVAYRYLELKYGIDYQRREPLNVQEQTEIAAFLQHAVDAGIPLSYNNFQQWSRNHDSVPYEVLPSLDEVARGVLQKEDLDAAFVQRKELFFAELSRCRETKQNPLDIVNTFFNDASTFFGLQKLDDAQRAPYIQEIIERITTLPMIAEHNLLQTLAGEYPQPTTTSQQELQNTQIAQFNLKLVTAVRLFKQDGDEFYETVKDIMDHSGIDASQLSRVQIATLCIPLLRDAGNGQFVLYGFGADRVPETPQRAGVALRKSNYDRLIELPFLQIALQKNEPAPRDSMNALYKYTNDREHIITYLSQSGMPNYGNERQLYNDSLFGLVAFQGVEEAFLRMVQEGIPANERKQAYEFISRFYPKTEVARHVKSRLLLQEMEEITGEGENRAIDLKIDFVVRNIDDVGYEGLELLAQQITDHSDFRTLRGKLGNRLEEFLKPDSNATAIAAYTDTAISKLLKNYETLLKTCSADERMKIEMSTELASEWFKMALGRVITFQAGSSSIEGTFSYDSATHKLKPNAVGEYLESTIRQTQTVRELIDNLHGLPQSQKMFILAKVLSEGPLSYAASSQDRKVLGVFVQDILGMEQGFVNHLTQSLLHAAKGEELVIPVSTALSEYLFQGLAMDHIDYGQLENSRGILRPLSEDAYRELATAHTVDILEGRFHAGSSAYTLSQQKIALFHQTEQQLGDLFPLQISSQEVSLETGISSNIDALISGLEASNPLTIRALQSAYLLLDLQPVLKKRLSNSFDKNPGMSKLMYWYNLDNYITTGTNPTNQYTAYREIAEYAGENGNLVSVHGKLGGGSFNTTYRGIVKDGDSGEVEAAIKLLNPNAEAHIQDFYALMVQAVQEMETQIPPLSQAEIHLARKTMFLVKMAYQWSKNDLNNGTFAADDPRFQDTLQQFNQEFGESFVASRVLFTSKLMNVDTIAQGDTLIELLRSEAVDSDQKRGLLERVSALYDFQTRTAVQATDGSQEYLLQSDPNPGNFIVDPSTGRITVIDRNYYLHLNEQKVEVLHSLQAGRYGRFFNQFLQTVLAENRVAEGETKPDGRGVYSRREARMKNALIRSTLPAQLGLAFANELRKGGGITKLDPIDLMHVLFERFQATPLRQKTIVIDGHEQQIVETIEVSTDLLLAIKNVLIFNEYGRTNFQQE